VYTGVKEPLSIYVHIPFCIKKCYYCDFNSYPINLELAQSYLAALQKEIVMYGIKYADRKRIQTIYIGGGTPTVYKGEEIAAIIGNCREQFLLSEASEITVECNPGTVDKEKLLILKEAGVNRLSIGVQALHDRLLKALGRIHSVRQFYRNYQLAREMGFTNLSFDLIFGLPGQTLAEWQETLQIATQLQPEHLSVYGLQVENGTLFGELQRNGQLPLPDEDTELAMYVWAIDYLQAQGYEHYEISNFARQGYRSQHNLVYWHNQEYLGVGAGAHSYIDGQRFANCFSPEKYIELIENKEFPVEWQEKITFPMSMTETMMLGLRLREGVNNKVFCKRYGVCLTDVYGRVIDELIQKDLVSYKEGVLCLTRRGLLLANQVMQDFVL